MQERMYINRNNELVVAETLLECFYANNKEVFIYLTDSDLPSRYSFEEAYPFPDFTSYRLFEHEYFAAKEARRVISKSYCNPKAIVSEQVTLMEDYYWDEEIGAFPIFIAFQKDGKACIANVQELTDRELRAGHNIERIYRNGGFNL